MSAAPLGWAARARVVVLAALSVALGALILGPDAISMMGGPIAVATGAFAIRAERRRATRLLPVATATERTPPAV